MKKFILPIPKTYNAEKILKICHPIYESENHLTEIHLACRDLSINHPNPINKNLFKDGTGGLHLMKEQSEYDWNRLNSILHDTYIEEIYNELREYATIGRVVYSTLSHSIDCLANIPSSYRPLIPWHKDKSYRLHIPITTNEYCWVLFEGEKIYQMPEIGRLYFFDGTAKHTAFNVHISKNRAHLVFTIKPNMPFDDYYHHLISKFAASV